MTHLDRVLSMLALLLVFTLDEVRLAHARPHGPDLAHGFTYPAVMHVGGGADLVYLSMPDLAVRWGLGLLVGAACFWVLAHTLKPEPRAPAGANRRPGPFG